MKLKSLVLALCLSPAAAFAGDSCEAACVDTVKQCQDVCKKTLKKEAPDKVSFCQSQCKEFESECKKDCKSEGK